MKAKQQSQQPYNDDEIIAKALEILSSRIKEPGQFLNSPTSIKQYLTITLSELEHEEFFVILLDAQNRLIHTESMFRGTLTQTSVYPREIVKLALKHNASAMAMAHNHPSGALEPSNADRHLTDAIKQTMSMIDVRVLDHFIVAGTKIMSFAERGMI